MREEASKKNEMGVISEDSLHGETESNRRHISEKRLIQKGRSPRIIQKFLPMKWREMKIWGIFRIFLLITIIGVISIMSFVGYIAYLFISLGSDLPSIDALKIYKPPIVTEVYSESNKLIGEFFEFRRKVIPLEKISKHTIDAFICAEDADFYSHKGIDNKGIIRAAIKNILSGRIVQGGSTITQQVARSFLLTPEKKLKRKIKEILLAKKIERNFSKDYILYLYMNQVYLGHGAYGIESAAELYFGKRAKDLDLAESALIAGLIQAPSRYSPFNNFRLARERQLYVLREMMDKKKISKMEMENAISKKLEFSPMRNINLDESPYFTEHVRRYLVDRFGHDKVYLDGLKVWTTLDDSLIEAGKRAVVMGVRNIDKKMGWRGHIKRGLDRGEWESFLKGLEKEYIRKKATPQQLTGFEPLPPFKPVVGEIYTGIVEESSERYAIVLLPGEIKGVIPLKDMDWAYPYNPKLHWKYREKVKRVSDVLREGDVILVRVLSLRFDASKIEGRSKEANLLHLALEQEPLNDAALLSLRVSDGAIISMVGGKDFSKSEFNRATQARRQTGSAFKPIVYAAALENPEKRYNPSTIIMDSPMAMPKGADFKELWRPDNYGKEYMGDTTFRKGLVLSRNIVTLKILQDIGVRYTIDFARRLGIESPINQDLSLGLGSSSLTLLELCKAYLVFPTLGKAIEPYFIKRIVDRDGNLLYKHKPHPPRQIVSPETSYIMTNLMMDVVRYGTATRALELKVPTAGKTGTTNDFIDAWYIGFTPMILCGVWTGFDTPRSMGKGFTGGDTALPIFVDYMKDALVKYADTNFPPPANIVFRKVDSDTGLLVNEGDEGVVVAFKKGVEPTDYMKTDEMVRPSEFFAEDPFIEGGD